MTILHKWDSDGFEVVGSLKKAIATHNKLVVL